MIAVTNEDGFNVSANAAHVANANPFRYRGYYHDDEIGMYYLQSRYYDPVVGRFVNGDDALILATSKSIISYNLFSYCNNDSINEKDNSGYALNDYIHAIGIQISVTIGGIPLGFEFLWSTKTWEPVVFMFTGLLFKYWRDLYWRVIWSFINLAICRKYSLSFCLRCSY